MSSVIEIRLKRINKIYHENDALTGFVVINSKTDTSHNGVTLSLDGTVNLQLSAKSVGTFEAFYNSIKPIPLISYTCELIKPGKLPSGVVEVPFEISLVPQNKTRPLYETYHGVFINIQYMITVDMKKSILSRDISKQCEFMVESRPDQGEKAAQTKVDFVLNPSNISNSKEKAHLPSFEIKGTVDSIKCCITQPFTGKINVLKSDVGIRSIEIQLIRIETCGCAEGYARDATEIQNIQIADGDVCRDLEIPLYMIFPRLFTCPTIFTDNFKIEFEVNIVIIFSNDHLVSENIPIKLTRY